MITVADTIPETMKYIAALESQNKGLKENKLKLEAKNQELLARIEQYKVWQDEKCSCKGE